MDWRDVDNKLSSRGVKRECPICGHDEPWLHAERVIGLVLVEDDGRMRDRHVQAAGLGCENCGFLRLHNLQVLGISRVEPRPEAS